MGRGTREKFLKKAGLFEGLQQVAPYLEKKRLLPASEASNQSQTMVNFPFPSLQLFDSAVPGV